MGIRGGGGGSPLKNVLNFPNKKKICIEICESIFLLITFDKFSACFWPVGPAGIKSSAQTVSIFSPELTYANLLI